ncbi:MAG: methyltransferase C-terminal domain-containing protein, partial [Chloroflexota bacterium]|nr:methyltransferase C-terminal domain-containing protein [Chloroflexota bacterium]
KLKLFCKKVLKIKSNLLDLFEKISNDEKKVYGYGAPAKASTLINFIGENNLKYIYDKSHLKQGKYLPGTSIKIKDPSEIQHYKPDYIFLFAWNFSKEIIDDLKNNFNFNGKLIIPIPDLRIIDID